MDIRDFVVVGENIHCTRMVKRGGIKMTTLPGGGEAVAFKWQGQDRTLPVPATWGQVSPDFEKGKCKHVALAIWQILNGQGSARQDGEDYLAYVAERQIANGATFLDVNVDEYSADAKLNGEIMKFVVTFLGRRFATPLSIDSSNPDILAIGLQHCRKDIRAPMVNSVSLEREASIGVVKQYGADAIVGAAGHHVLPANTEERLANFRAILGQLERAGIAHGKLHLDPLVLPVSTDYNNGKYFLEATRAARQAFPGVHLNGGFSNISFGMPNRKLLNMVFIRLCLEAGSDGGIIDPAAIPMAAVAALNPAEEAFQFAKAVLTGEDAFGMEYITAFREGKLGKDKE